MDDSFENWLKERAPETDADDGRLSPGTAIGTYRIEAFLGKGGFAEIYSAKASNGECVAIKILHRLDEQSRMRFERESHILSQIHHPNIPKLLSFGSCGNRPYLVTELLHAEELPHSDRKVAWLVKKVCTAVAALHKLGYAHRDIKPSNILWRDEEPVLIDYGLACPFSDGPVPPSTLSIVEGRRIVVGTAGYAAPEQFAGGKIDASTDIHAIGMLAYSCFDGHPPQCWRRIIDCATNSRNNARYPNAEALSAQVDFRHFNPNDLNIQACQGLPVPARSDVKPPMFLLRSFQEEVKRMIVEMLGVPAEMVALESRLVDDLGADYMDCSELISVLDKHWGVRTPIERCGDIVTVADVCDYYYDVLNYREMILGDCPTKRR